jgi:hypothetical protein
MIDVLTEDLVSLADSCKLFPKRRGGVRPHLSCMYRWTVSGCKGIKLESVQVGGTRCTSKQAIARFIAALSGDRGDAVQVRTPRQRQRAAEQANAELSAAGW